MNHKEIHRICKEHKIKNYTINEDDSIDVDGDVDLYSNNLKKLPLRFNKVNGDFVCGINELTTLEGSPKEVGGDFACSYNNLTSLKGAPREVGGEFFCWGNPVELNHNSYLKSVKRLEKLEKL